MSSIQDMPGCLGLISQADSLGRGVYLFPVAMRIRVSSEERERDKETGRETEIETDRHTDR